jgi:signal transduction histidine kinase
MLLMAQITFSVFVLGQSNSSTYQLKEKLKHFQQQRNYLSDTAYANTLIDLAYIYSSSYPDSALLILAGNSERCQASGYKEGEINTYMAMGDAFQTKGIYNKALENYGKSYRLAKDIRYLKAIPLIVNRMGIICLNQGNYVEALNKFYESLKAAEAINNSGLIGATLNNIAIVYLYQDELDEAERAYRQRLQIAQKMGDTSSMSFAYNGIGEVNLKQKRPVKALSNLTIAYDLASKINDPGMLLTAALSMAEADYALGSLQKSASFFEDALCLAKQTDNAVLICNALIGLAEVRYKQGLLKEALSFGLEGLQKAEKMGQVQLMRDANEIVSTIYEALDDDTDALKYYRRYKVYSDSMNNLASRRAAAIEKANYEFSKKEIEFQRKALQQRWITFSAATGLLILAVILWLINRNRKQLDNTNKELQKKNGLIEIEKLKAEDTLSKLQATQAQLIQSEKMAALGELTAGVAHEIQNPLNFVNNFSDLNAELVEELEQEANTGNIEEVKSIATNIKDNERKINYHGKRADAIVKGMLQHSRASSGKKELTDINALADEYLRLSYHGFRAKDKGFDSAIETDFDESVGKIQVVPQDIGRVLLNLFNNAFYAVSARQKSEGEAFKPIVRIQTKKVGSRVEVIVKDNGNGIPQNIIDKIFQPFFTTKPTGQGTGLGLSLSYDIIKSHEGGITVKSKEGEGSEFVIRLPIKA